MTLGLEGPGRPCSEREMKIQRRDGKERSDG